MTPTTKMQEGGVSRWLPIEDAPRDGTLIDVKFDPHTAEIDYGGKRPLSMAEFYAPGSTKGTNPADPVICGVTFTRGHFRPIGEDGTEFYACDMSITLTHFRHPSTDGGE